VVIGVNESVLTIVLATLASVAGPLLIFIVAWIKLRPEMGKMRQDSHASEADAAETALRATEMAVVQVNKMQQELYAERDKRRELEIIL